MAPLIGLYSPAPGCGKSTLANGMAGFGWRCVKFAAPLKAMLAALMREAGEDEATIADAIEGRLKEAPLQALAGATPRRAMQTLGTEWGRGCIAEDLWVRLFLLRAQRHRAAGAPVVCDDMRFANEAEAIRGAGGLLIRVDRPGVEPAGGHASEGGLAGFDFDLVVRNDAPTAISFALDWAPRVSAFGYGRGLATV
jgi:hypothetical protein